MTANMRLYKSFILCWLSSVSVAFVNGPRRVTPRATTSWSSTTLLGMGLTLYGSQGSRSPLVNWALYELGLEFEMGDLRKNPHPFGQIPCLTDNDDVSVFESGAILLYINSLSEEKLSPAEKAQVMSWVMWANASLDPICFLETPDGKVYVLCLLILKVMSPL
jgi:glutathione S-transferase/alpha,alpha-trehalase